MLYTSLLAIFAWHSIHANETTKESVKLHKYEEKYKNIASTENRRTAIVILAFNRPFYLQQLLSSLEANQESNHLPFYFMLDGGSHASQSENNMVIEKSAIKNKHIIFRDRNYGICKNLIDAKKFIFDWCNYEKIIVLEDDLIVSPHYIKVILDLHDWAKKEFDNMGTVSCWTYCFLDKEAKQAKLALVKSASKRHYGAL